MRDNVQSPTSKNRTKIAAAQDSVQRIENKTGLPDNLKSGIESMSGIDMSSVQVKRNSSEPAKVGALAYAQGNQIHLAPGQEKHLPHEAWHVVQQAQGRVKPTTSVNGKAVNDNPGLEKEADVMGAKALQLRQDRSERNPLDTSSFVLKIVQGVFTEAQQKEFDTLNMASEGPDEAMRKRAQTLMEEVKADETDRGMVGPLIQKFSSSKKKSAVSKGPNPWEWTPERLAAVKIMEDANARLTAGMQKVSVTTGKFAALKPDPIENVLTKDTVVEVVEYVPGKQAGLGLWMGLLKELVGSDGQPRIHVINFKTLDGSEIRVRLSEHLSAHDKKSPDYFVHDDRAELYMHSTSGIQQGSPLSDPSREKELNKAGDTLMVSYEAFSGKLIKTMKHLKVDDKKVAEWMLLIIMSPSIAQSVIQKEHPDVKKGEMSLIFELVSTWMLAEPARHLSSMISGVLELELIESGARTFRDALTVTHPMSHQGSEAHGRSAQKAEKSNDPKSSGINYNAAMEKQKAQFDMFGVHARAEIFELVRFYTEEVSKALMK